jgi:hypothetical protein
MTLGGLAAGKVFRFMGKLRVVIVAPAIPHPPGWDTGGS